MWKEDGFYSDVDSDDIATTLLPENISSKEVIETVYKLGSQQFGFVLPPDWLRETAQELYCTDPYLFQKAMAVNNALNFVSSQKGTDEPVN